MDMSSLDKYKLYTGNHLDILPLFDDCTFDFCLTSPPYDNQRKYKGFDFQFEPLAEQLYRVIAVGGVLVWIVNDATNDGCESLTSFKQVIYFVEECGFNLYDTMVYAKNNYAPLTHRRYEQCFEYMFVFSKGRPKTFNPIMESCKCPGDTRVKRHLEHTATAQEKRSAMRSGKYRKASEIIVTKTTKQKSNIWHYSVGKGHSTLDQDAFNHPAIFPEQLARDHIISWTNRGDAVLDPMMGSGTVGKMCGLLERRFVGIDICAEYVEIAKKRIEKAYSQALQIKMF